MDIKNLHDEIAAHSPGTFIDLIRFNDHQFGAVDITGVSPVWEMHPDTDEFFYILEGEAEFVLLEEGGENRYDIPAGSVFVVPKGIWHKPGAPGGVKMVYLTPGESLHSDAEDPRR